MRETTGLSGAGSHLEQIHGGGAGVITGRGVHAAVRILVQVEVCRATGMVATPYCDENDANRRRWPRFAP